MRAAPWVIVLAGCKSVQVVSALPPAAPPASLPAPAQRGELAPASLVRVDSRIRDVDDALSTRNWPAAESALADATQAWGFAAPVLRLQGASVPVTREVGAGLSVLAQDVASRHSRVARADAIFVGNAVTELVGQYLNRVPADVSRLELALRRVQLDADVANWDAAAQDVIAAAEAWDRIAPDAEALGRIPPIDVSASNVARDVPEAIDRLRKAVTHRSVSGVDLRVHVASQDVAALRRIFEGTRGDVTP